MLLFSPVSNKANKLGNYSKNKNGLGLKNVEKLLKLLYAGEYLMNIKSAPDTFSVEMKALLKINEVLLKDEGDRKNARVGF